MPKVVEKNDQTKLLIAGSICNQINVELLNENVVLIGKVDHLADFYNLGDIVINPTDNGSGLKIKSIEALMYNKILISHPHAIEGFFEQDNVPIKLASTPQEYVNVISDLFSDPQKIIESKNEIESYMKKYNLFVKNQIQKVFACNLNKKHK